MSAKAVLLSRLLYVLYDLKTTSVEGAPVWIWLERERIKRSMLVLVGSGLDQVLANANMG